ncbi:hypothetical protein BCU84_20380 [Shewanella sp. 10N.286.51.B7]|uniref:hypothetical protein n=1 Tax=Shewanella sp. 10N.286.51.B7 TaxID=1880836 RepID=UPI000C84CF88|nr:hypothetical protein [Shewanella sp. 10N.286.51.B7]PMG70168.1 hypothetical protein BCU84_20380 [Shewanella sp. 10N.286.51.B7]
MKKVISFIWKSCALCLVAAWFNLLFTDPVIDSVMSDFEYDSTYELFINYRTRQIIEEGELRSFSDCLKKYKTIGTRRKQTGEYKSYNLIINKKLSFVLHIYGGNVHSFYAAPIKDGGIGRYSKPYGVNCDLTLLNSK